MFKMQKIRYEIDPHNQLVRRLSRFRKVIDGKFKLDKKNTLIYHVKAPVPRDANVPHQVKLRGKWALTKDHDLTLTLDKWGRQTYGDKLTLQGNITDVRKNSLLFTVTTKSKDNVQSIYVLKLAGSWQADKNNRLTFRVKKEKGRHDILIFNGIWEINKNHRIIYRYEKARLIRKRKKIHTLAFKGHWDISDRTRISYVISRNTDSVFSFKPKIRVFGSDYLKYEVEAVLSRKPKPLKQTVTLIFAVEVKLTPRGTIKFRLKSSRGKGIGATLELSRKLLKGDGQVFLRVLKTKREATIYAGAGWRW